ncbi:MAG: beta-N-acetylhexosaminidase [Pseudorhodoplanes sp.]|nr:beta-N-acetylhexosaminidase [Pseudorhodoplanes sp.]
MTVRAFITGLSGSELTADERSLLRESAPWGVILFRRNVETPDQVRALTAACRDCLGRDAPILVDQEGGRVQRLGPPHWPVYPPAAAFGRIYRDDRAAGLEAAALGARLIAADLRAVGLDVSCLPVADCPVAEADPIIGDRAYGDTTDQIAALAGAAAEGLMAGGVLPVLKHLPGHGRATADSHLALPVVDAPRAVLEASDFVPFRALRTLPLGMTAHVVFSAIDPVAPATTSAIMVRDVIRGIIGFQGVLMSDDLSMRALSGPLGGRTRAALAAGCDIVLHCNGDLAEMTAVADASPALAGEALARADAALARRRPPAAIDLDAARQRFATLVGAARPGTDPGGQAVA